jgi:hypothetical protein
MENYAGRQLVGNDVNKFNNFGTLGVTATEAKRELALGTIIEDFDRDLKVFEELADRLCAVGDKLAGPTPRPVSGESNPGVPLANSALASLRGRRERLYAILSALGYEVQRLESHI